MSNPIQVWFRKPNNERGYVEVEFAPETAQLEVLSTGSRRSSGSFSDSSDTSMSSMGSLSSLRNDFASSEQSYEPLFTVAPLAERASSRPIVNAQTFTVAQLRAMIAAKMSWETEAVKLIWRGAQLFDEKLVANIPGIHGNRAVPIQVVQQWEGLKLASSLFREASHQTHSPVTLESFKDRVRRRESLSNARRPFVQPSSSSLGNSPILDVSYRYN